MSSNNLTVMHGLLAAVQRRWGPAALRPAADTAVRPDLLATGLADLDAALGGGLPRGRIIEIGGRPTSGMRTLALRVLAQAQAPAQLVAYVDVAGTFDAEYAAGCGVDLAHVLVARPHSVRELFDLTRALVASGDVAAMIVDSFATALADRQGARLLSTALDRPLPLLPTSRCAVLALHDEPDVSHDRLAGGSLAHAATVRLLVEHVGWTTTGHGHAGYRCRVVLRKHPRVAAGVVAAMTVPIQAR
jgi:recombination protein RecA